MNYVWRIILVLVLYPACICFGQDTFTLYGPDSSHHIIIHTKPHVSYKLYAGSTAIAGVSKIDLKVKDGPSISLNTKVKRHRTTKISENIVVPVPYRRKNIVDRYNQLTLDFTGPFSIEFRLYNNGCAYRINTKFKNPVIIAEEVAQFEIDSSAIVWFAHIDKRPGMDRFHTSFEGAYRGSRLASVADTMLTYAPVTVSLSNGHHIAITDAGLHDYPGMFLQPGEGGLNAVFAPYPLKEHMTTGEFPQLIVTERASYIAKINGTRSLPWRVMMVAKNEIELVSNDLVYALGEPSTISDPSWIRPGKGTDEWITGINLFNVDFIAGLNTATYKYYIDFAKRFGFDQVMLDAGWSDYKDLLKINPAIDMEALAAYAKQQGVRLMLWTLCSTLDKQLDSALKQFSKWGINAIMTDFMDRDDQPTVNFYHRIAKACAENKISIMFHGAFPPKGFNRTWPNVLTHEGVLGAEWNIWSDLATPEHNVTVAFTRMLAGPLDYEPGLLLNAQKDQFRPIGKNPMSIGTRCHQLAMFVTYDSPLQIFSGNISQGIKEPDFMELLGSIPTTWDDTKILQGKIGEYIITARQHGNNWFISGLNGSKEKIIELDLSFLGNSNFHFSLCKDGINANNYGSDYHLSNGTLTSNETIPIVMANGGGFLLRLTKQ